MKKSARWTRQQKIDGLIDVIFMLIFLLCLMLLKYFGISTSFLWPILLFPWMINGALRRKRMFREVTMMMELLDIPVAELRKVLGFGSYDLTEWDEKRTLISLPHLYRLVDYVEERYFLAFHEQYNKEAAAKKLAEKQAAVVSD
ncbi:hypothetical protein [Enterococcus cecorum]|uniref:hypothetical protein n=1 Tax=Enterococcus cecorum TaxID=44008 RepID=UPI00148C2C0C|nr:hypothetical protein [Enterococcus cecorum]MDZ5502299.1 hypothetical protein [Enterococcus cecorum]MDZ5508448.1 hypothetical protein [Enterococcus cecorum]MDZ5555828.1 hypothetical protein [Enterococcus cecorum]MDZ5558255.1 hypothetical protein [Enterococcus cecorum]MDZ5570773.1 hypothetical protein [Enterococcus cecorum]